MFKMKGCIQLNEKKYVMTDDKCETVDIKEVPKLDDQTKKSIRTELSTGLSLAIVYFIFIFSVPALNWFKPEWAFAKMFGGMSYSWFLTTIVAMAMAFIIAYLHTKLYERWENKNFNISNNGKKSEEIKIQEPQPNTATETVQEKQVVSKEDSLL